MMRSDIVKTPVKGILTVLCLLGLVAISCGPVSKAGAPSAEPMLPGPVLAFPRTVVIDVGTIMEGSSGSLSKMIQASAEETKSLGSGGEFTFLVDIGGDLASAVSEVTEGVLSEQGILGSIEVERATTVTTYTGQLPSTPSATDEVDDALAGVEVKIDFGDFTTDGKSVTCSGNTETLPVCVRVWINAKRLMAGYLTSIPTETNAGAGIVWMNVAPFDAAVGADFALGLKWDHTQETTDGDAIRTTELFIDGSPETGVSMQKGHMKLQQTGDTGNGAEKMVQMAVGFERTETLPFDSLAYTGEWIEGKNFFSGTIDLAPLPEGAELLTAQCVALETGNAALRTECQTAGIDVGDVPALSQAAAAEYTFPDVTAFPATPTF